MLQQAEPPLDTLTTARLSSINALTGLRFIAALLVLVCHAAYLFSYTLPLPIYKMLVNSSNGVTIFFILSGFVLYYNYYSNINIKAFFVARFARIYPVYFFGFLLACLLNFRVNYNPLVLLQYLTLTQAWNAHNRVTYSFDFPAWSVSDEAFFYLCFPFLVLWLLPRFKTLVSLLILIVLCAVIPFLLSSYFFVSGTWNVIMPDHQDTLAHYVLYQLPVTRIFEFIAGCVLAKIYLLRISISKSLSVFLLYGSITFVLLVMINDAPGIVVYQYTSAYIIPFALIIFILASHPEIIVSRFLASRLLILLGEASYSFYMLHIIFLQNTVGILEYPWQAYPYILCLILLISYASIVTFRKIEIPARKKLRRILDN